MYIDRSKLKNHAVRLDGLDECIIKVVDGYLVYSYSRMVKHFMKQGMSEEEAIDYVEFNIVGLLPMNTFRIKHR